MEKRARRASCGALRLHRKHVSDWGLWWSILARKIPRLPLLIGNWLLGEATAFSTPKHLTLVSDSQKPNPAVKFMSCMFLHTSCHLRRHPSIFRRKDAYYAAVALATIRIWFSVAVTRKRHPYLGQSERSRFRNADRLVDYSDQ